MPLQKKILVLAMGNDIMGDDGAAIEAVRLIGNISDNNVSIEELFGGGLELLDLMEGREKVLIIDTISTGNFEPGTILEFTPREFRELAAPMPHYAGLPEVMRISEMLNISFPEVIRILAIETLPQLTLKEGLSQCIHNAVPELACRMKKILSEWGCNGL